MMTAQVQSDRNVCDTAYGIKKANDYSVVTVWGEAENGFYLIDLWRGRAEFPQLKRQLIAMAAEWRPNALLVERKSSGISLVQELQQGTRLPILPIEVDTDKATRAWAASPLVEAGKVFLPKAAHG